MLDHMASGMLFVFAGNGTFSIGWRKANADTRACGCWSIHGWGHWIATAAVGVCNRELMDHEDDVARAPH